MMDRSQMRQTTRDFQLYYNPELHGEIRLDTNTNVLGSNPAATRFLKEMQINIDGYPNTYSDGLRDALGELYGLERNNFVIGSGSDEMLDVCFKTFTDWGDYCAYPVPSYTLYEYFMKVNGCTPYGVDLDESFQLDVDGLLKTNSKIILMPSPNNPTGNCFRTKDIEEILTSSDGIVIVDEAYGEYADESMIKKVNEFDNLIVLRTFSKAYAMAGLRVGYAVAGKATAEMMNCVKIPYSVNAVSEGAAIAAVKDQEFIKKSRKLIDTERPKLDAGLKKLGFETFPSNSNFILAKSPIDHSVLVSELKRKGILIRDFGSKRRTENCVRTTVGTEELNVVLLKKIEEVLSGC